MGEVAVPELVDPEDIPALCRYLSWHALATEFMCGIVARGIPLAPTRDIRRALMHQVRSENTHASWLVSRVVELGGEVPERDESLVQLQDDLVRICDRSWLEYLVAAQVAMRGYMGPYVRALEVLWDRDEQVGGFSREVLGPEVAAHFQRALGDLRTELTSRQGKDREEAFALAINTEEGAFGIFETFIARSYPMLEAFGVDIPSLVSEVSQQRQDFWTRLRDTLEAEG